MDNFGDFMSDMLRGFKIIGVILFYVIIWLGIFFGVISIILVFSGLNLYWWFIPFWLELLIVIAWAIGKTNK